MLVCASLQVGLAKPVIVVTSLHKEVGGSGGVDGEVEYNADDMALELGTIGYEILCNISKRVQRFYKINDLMVMSD